VKRGLAGAVLISVGLWLAGCGAGSPSHTLPHISKLASNSPGRSRRASSRHEIAQVLVTITPAAPASLREGALPRVDMAQSVFTEGAGLLVMLRAVIDPLTGSGARLPAGTRAVAVLVQIRNGGPAVYDSSATGDFAVIPSSGIATPVLATRGLCKTPQEDFDRYITAGEDRVGCVVYAVPDGATVSEVRFSPHARSAGRLVWAA